MFKGAGIHFGCLARTSVKTSAPTDLIFTDVPLLRLLSHALSTGIMANLEQWVNDRLHDILGLSDRYVSQFMIGTARKASSSQDLVSRLEQTGTIDIDQNVIAFAQELFDKVYTSYSIIIPCEGRHTLAM